MIKVFQKSLPSFLAILLFIGFGNSAFAQEADAVVGKWFNEEKDGAVEIIMKGDDFSGKIVWSLEQDKLDEEGNNERLLDENNGDSELAKREIIGLNILNGFAFNSSKKQWTGGKIYDPKNGKTYDCYMWLNDDGTLSIKGYIGVKWLGRETLWSRSK